MLALGITNTGIALKKQYFKALRQDYEEQREIARKILADLANNRPQKEKLKLNLIAHPEIAPPIMHLQEIVLSRLSTAGRALATVTELSDAVINLNDVLKRRNDWIIRLRNDDLPPRISKVHFYFGLPRGDGVDEEFPSTVKGISVYTDDVIFYGSELCADLVEHADLLVDKFSKGRFGGQAPKASQYDLSQAYQEGWIPAAEGYTEWTSGFKKAVKEQRKPWWANWFIRRKQ